MEMNMIQMFKLWLMSFHWSYAVRIFNRTMNAIKSRSRVKIWLQSIRDAYVILLPVTVIGAVALSIAESAFIGQILHSKTRVIGEFHDFFLNISHASLGVMGLLGSMIVAAQTYGAINLNLQRGNHSVLAISGISGVTFLIAVFQKKSDLSALGYSSVFQSLVIGILVAELMSFLGNHLPSRLDLNSLEKGASLGHALELSASATIVVLLVGFIYDYLQSIANHLTEIAVPAILDAVKPLPFNFLWLNPILVLLNQLLWCLGINGGQLLLSIGENFPGIIASTDSVFDPERGTLMYLNAYAHLGGAGATWGLIISILLRGRDLAIRRLAWYSILPAVFNVNELLLFGLPLVLNRAMVMPFVLAPLVCCLISDFAIWIGFLDLVNGSVVWSTPILASGYTTSGSWRGVAVQLISASVSAIVYWPYVRLLENKRDISFRENLASALNELPCGTKTEPMRFIDRTDSVGDVARSLAIDFKLDLGTERVKLAYQPQHARDGQVVGLEALLRWNHATLGPISTAAIVNISEESELVHAIGEWVLEQAATDIRAWRDQGLDSFTVSINISPLQLENAQWTQIVQRVMTEYEIRKNDLKLEITEGQAIANSDRSDQTLSEILALGLDLSMDDFGMGCTSLLYMQRFRLSSIKLDGKLTRNVISNKVDQDIVRCVCHLGHAQDVKVVAEFVETEVQRIKLEELGCDIFQGWLYSPAIAADKIPAYIEKFRYKSAIAE
jgi:lactose/cellobiose-specific phosphotransferase system IIC component